MNSAVAEIKKLSEQLSQMRQENIVLKVGREYLNYECFNLNNIPMLRRRP